MKNNFWKKSEETKFLSKFTAKFIAVPLASTELHYFEARYEILEIIWCLDPKSEKKEEFHIIQIDPKEKIKDLGQVFDKDKI